MIVLSGIMHISIKVSEGQSECNFSDPFAVITPQKPGLCNHLRPSVCLFVCYQYNSKANGLIILMKFGSMTDNNIGKNPLKFGDDPDLRPGRNTFNFNSITCWLCGRQIMLLPQGCSKRSDVIVLRYSV